MHRSKMISMIVPMLLTKTRWLYLCAFFAGCVSGETRPWQKITTIGYDSGARDGRVDYDVISPDGGAPDFAVTTIESEREIWLVVDNQSYMGSPRAILDPPQAPIMMPMLELLESVRGVKPFFLWRGPETPSDLLLKAALEAQHVSAPLYIPQQANNGQIGEQELGLELRYLESQLFQRSSSYRVDGRPVVGLVWSEARSDEITRVINGLNELGSRPLIVLFRTGLSPLREFEGIQVSPCRTAQSANPDSNTEVPCVAPDALPSALGKFQWDVVSGRRWSDSLGLPLVIDGVQRWEDDRQIDPLAPQDSIRMVEDGATQPVPSYRSTRLDAVKRLVQSAQSVAQITEVVDSPYIVGAQLRIRIEEGSDEELRIEGSTDEARSGRAILNHRPWVAPAHSYLLYNRSHAGVYLRVIDVDGNESEPSPAAGLQVCLRLAGEVQRRIEDLELVVREESAGMPFSVTGIQMGSSPPNDCSH